MKPAENLSQASAPFPEIPQDITPDQAVVHLYYLFSKWLDSGCPVRIYQVQAPQTQPDTHPLMATPPEEIRQLVQLLFARYEGRSVSTAEQMVEAKDIPVAILRVLNEFASQVARKGCSVRAVFGPGSCNIGDVPGYQVVTDSGNQFWSCSG